MTYFDKVKFKHDYKKFKKGTEAIYLKGNDIISYIRYQGKDYWINNKHLEL